MPTHLPAEDNVAKPLLKQKVPPISVPWLGLNPVQQAIYYAELKGNVYSGPNLGKSIYTEFSSEAIRDFVQESQLYDMVSLRWRLSENGSSEEELCVALHQVVDSIIAHFQLEHTRSAFLTRDCEFQYDSGPRSASLMIPPDISILGSGKNFSPHTSLKRPFFLNCVSVIQVGLENDPERYSIKDVIQASVFAKQCFVQQHNRKFVYVLSVTERKARLCMFDRLGVCHSSRIDIHEQPGTFVRLILGICSGNDEAVGYDTSVYWSGTRRFLKILDSEGNSTRYRIIHEEPFFVRKITIQGRGSVCWHVVDRNGTSLIVKDAWRHRDRMPETEYLCQIKGLDGVTQMVAYENGLSAWQTREKYFKELMHDEDRSVSHDRFFSRVLLEISGKSLELFDSAIEVLYAFYDAIRGHENLWKVGILHQDISMNNILIGLPGCAPGRRGTLIDLDMALYVHDKLPVANDHMGTRLTQSIHVLKSKSSSKLGLTTLHDYLDDLEGFYHALSNLTHLYPGVGEALQPFPNSIASWAAAKDANQAANAKLAFIRHNMENEVKVTPFFGEPFARLIKKLSKFFMRKILSKVDVAFLHAQGMTKKACRRDWESMQESSAEDYATVLRYFEEAIAEVESNPVADGSREDVPTTKDPPVFTAPSSTPKARETENLCRPTALKRTLDSEMGILQDSPHTKRLKSNVNEI